MTMHTNAATLPDPQLGPAFERLKECTESWWRMSIDEARRALRDMTLALNIDAPKIGMVIEGEIPGWRAPIPTRIFRPHDSGMGERLPVVLYFAGGSYTSGSVELVEPQLRLIANQAHCMVVAVEYGRAPEVKFPEPQENCLAAARWVFENIDLYGGDSERIALAGDGNGGELALSAAMGLRNAGGPQPIHLGLLSPLLQRNLYGTIGTAYRADLGYPDPSFLRAMIDLCLPRPGDDMSGDVRVNPLASATLAGLPPTMLIAGALDPAHHLDRQAVDRLSADGVPVRFLSYSNQCPGSPIWIGQVEAGRKMLDDLISGLAEAFGHRSARQLTRQRLRVVG